MSKEIIKAENLLRGYKGIAAAFKISLCTAKRKIKEYNITRHKGNHKGLYFDYSEFYKHYILGK